MIFLAPQVDLYLSLRSLVSLGGMTTVVNVNTTINLYFHFFRLMQGPMVLQSYLFDYVFSVWHVCVLLNIGYIQLCVAICTLCGMCISVLINI